MSMIGGMEDLRNELAEEAIFSAKENRRLKEAETQIGKLAEFILQSCPEKIGKGDSAHDEGAVEVAIRLIRRGLEAEQGLKLNAALLAKWISGVVYISHMRSA